MNIAIVCQEKKILKEVAHEVALALGMFYVDAEEYIDYDLIEKERVLNVCSKEYLKLRETKAIQTISSYDNTVISISDELFTPTQNSSLISNFRTVVFLKTDNLFSKSSAKIVSKLGEKAREEEIEKKSNFVVVQNKRKAKQICDEIVSKLK